MSDELEREVLVYIEATYLADDPEFALDIDESLIDADVLDSLAMFEVAEHLSSTYGVEIVEQDVTIENFGTVGRIAALVRSKRAVALASQGG
ncbi:MAG: acyl carrier protein [Chloroflexi bacterium]|nr:acyl carrier protein [Chloroflexota bacterium]